MSIIPLDRAGVKPGRLRAVMHRPAYALTVTTGDETTLIPYLATDDAHAVAQAALWWGAQHDVGRRAMRVEVAPLALRRLAEGGSRLGAVLWIFGGAGTREGGGA